MPERTTRDLDIAVLSRDAARAKECLRRAGFTYQSELSIGGSSWTTQDGEALDVIEVEEPWWEAVLVQASTNRDVQNLPVVPLPFLVLLKLRAGRSRDVGDVSQMLGAANDYDLDGVRETIRNHAPDLVEDVESLIELGRLEMGGPGVEAP
jgi:hypothetical protein